MAERSIGRASAAIASGTLVSRLLGFASALLLWNTIGTVGGGADSFALANQLPNNIYAIVAGGTLSAIIVPQIVRALEHADGGAVFLNRLMTLGMSIFLAVAAIATVAAPVVVWIYTAAGRGTIDADAVALATAFAYWCLPQIFFYALYALTGEVLNARGVFGPYTWAPVVNNLVMITGLVVFLLVFGGVEGLPPAQWTPGMIALLAGGATLGIASQAIVLLLVWRRSGIRFRPDFRWRGTGLGQSGRLATWTFGMILVTQIAGIVETNVAFSATGNASVAVMGVAWLIFMLPHSIVAVSIAMPYFTRMSAHAAVDDRVAVGADLGAALRLVLLPLTFSAIGLAVIAMPFATLFSDTHAEAVALTQVLWAFLAGLVPFSALHVTLRGYYAMNDTRTPFFLQAGQSILFMAAAIGIGVWVAPEWRAVGLALAISVFGTVQTCTAIAIMRRRLPGLRIRSLLAQFLWFVAAMVPAAAAGFGMLQLLGGTGDGAFPATGFVGPAVAMVVVGLTMLVVYGAVLVVTRNPAASELLRSVRGRGVGSEPPVE